MLDWIIFITIFGGLGVLAVLWLFILLPKVMALITPVDTKPAGSGVLGPSPPTHHLIPVSPSTNPPPSQEESESDRLAVFKEIMDLERDFQKDVGNRAHEFSIAVRSIKKSKEHALNQGANESPRENVKGVEEHV